MQAWELFIQAQEAYFGAEATNMWLRSLRVLNFDARNLYLEADDPLQVQWFEEHVKAKLKTEFLNNNYRPIKVHLTLKGVPLVKKKNRQKTSVEAAPPLDLSPDPLDPWATMAHFIPPLATPLAYKVASTLLESLPSSLAELPYPLYFFGGKGVGKTHLLMAITQTLRQKGLNALFIRTETFTEHVVQAIRSSKMQEFRKAYRHADALLVDDVHLFARKTATQEEFFHTFNAFHLSGRPILLSGNSPPSLLQEIEERLISRFEWGITAELEKLAPEQLYLLLRQRAEALHLDLSEEVQEFLVSHFAQNIPSLCRALEALVLRSHLEKNAPSKALDLSTVKEYLQSLLEEEKKDTLSPERIVQAVADAFAIGPQELLGRSQQQECSFPRQIAMYLCRSELKMSFVQIGKFFQRDHSTVITSVNQVQKKREKHDKELLRVLPLLLKQLFG